MLISRRRRLGPDRYLVWKTAFLVAGALLGLLGMRLDSRPIVSVAMVLVLAGFVLRFLPQPRDAAAQDQGRDSSDGPNPCPPRRADR